MTKKRKSKRGDHLNKGSPETWNQQHSVKPGKRSKADIRAQLEALRFVRRWPHLPSDGSIAALIARGYEQVKDGALNDAIATFESVLRVDPKNKAAILALHNVPELAQRAWEAGCRSSSSCISKRRIR